MRFLLSLLLLTLTTSAFAGQKHKVPAQRVDSNEIVIVIVDDDDLPKKAPAVCDPNHPEACQANGCNNCGNACGSCGSRSGYGGACGSGGSYGTGGVFGTGRGLFPNRPHIFGHGILFSQCRGRGR